MCKYGSYKRGEIEIIPDTDALIKKVENERKTKVLKLGLSESAAQLGEVFADEYLTIYRDPVIFPNGNTGTYLRIHENTMVDGIIGVIVLPLMGNNIILQRVFRHGVRSWEIELPRGALNKDLSPIENAKQELSEEIGYSDIKRVVEVGLITSNTGFFAGYAKAFLIELVENEQPLPKPEKEEAFGGNIMVTIPELLQLMKDGKIRDSYSVSTIMLAIAKGLISI